MIKRIKIEGYKSFKSLDLKLSPVSVIFGPNASGKSNLLDAIQLISRMATCSSLSEAFEGHRGLARESFYHSAGMDRDRRPVTMSFEVDVEIPDRVVDKINRIILEKREGIDAAEPPKLYVRERFLRYAIALERLPDTGHLRVVNERLAALTRGGEVKQSRKPFLERHDDGREPRIHLRMERQSHPVYHQVGLDHTLISTSLYEPHYPHIAAFRDELSRWRTYYLEPKTLMRAEEPISPVQEIGPRGQNLAAFLNNMRSVDAKAFDSFSRTLSMALPFKAEVGIDHLDDGRLIVRLQEKDQHLSYSARLMSEGTLRLMGLIAAVFPGTPGTVICYEEPENGVHPGRVRTIADTLKGAARYYSKQLIITTHSPVFAKQFDEEQLFVCRKRGSTSSIEPFAPIGEVFKELKIGEALEDRMLRCRDG